MALAFCVILLGHLIGDFYAQSDHQAKEKVACRKACAAHCLSYALWMAASSAFLVVSGAGVLHAVGVFVALGASHAIVDAFLKPLLGKIADEELVVFVLGQTVHLAFVIACACCIAPEIKVMHVSEPTVIALLLVALLCGKPMSVVVKLVLKKARGAEVLAENPGNACKTQESDGGGSVIGILERLIVALLTYLSQYEAIAFVITAKSIARFKKLEDQGFAETYLIGTLTSVLLAMLVALGIKALLL